MRRLIKSSILKQRDLFNELVNAIASEDWNLDHIVIYEIHVRFGKDHNPIFDLIKEEHK